MGIFSNLIPLLIGRCLFHRWFLCAASHVQNVSILQNYLALFDFVPGSYHPKYLNALKLQCAKGDEILVCFYGVFFFCSMCRRVTAVVSTVTARWSHWRNDVLGRQLLAHNFKAPKGGHITWAVQFFYPTTDWNIKMHSGTSNLQSCQVNMSLR